MLASGAVCRFVTGFRSRDLSINDVSQHLYAVELYIRA
jgi:hypothetical protein